MLSEIFHREAYYVYIINYNAVIGQNMRKCFLVIPGQICFVHFQSDPARVTLPTGPQKWILFLHWSWCKTWSSTSFGYLLDSLCEFFAVILVIGLLKCCVYKLYPDLPCPPFWLSLQVSPSLSMCHEENFDDVVVLDVHTICWWWDTRTELWGRTSCQQVAAPVHLVNSK